MTDPTDVAGVLWSSVSSALTLACIRTHGQREAAALEYEAERRQHELTLAGARPRGPWRCAETHLDLDRRAGLRPEATEDAAGRVWLRYRSPHWSGHGTAGPPTTPAAFGAAIGEAHYRARHGTTAEVIGGPGVVFVHTHDLTHGDPCDAGYFEAPGEPPAPGEHYRRRRDVPMPVFGAEARPSAPFAGNGERSPWVSSAAWRMIVLVERLGVVGGAAVAEHALRTVLTALGGWLSEALSEGPVRTPLDAAHLYASVGRMVGDEVTVRDHDGVVVATCPTERLWDGHPLAPTALRDTVVRAWSATSPHHAWDIRARLMPPVAGDGARRVLFDRAEPGDRPDRPEQARSAAGAR
jgi:hypothetical protein